MTDQTLTAIFIMELYFAFFTWTVLTIIIVRQILKRNYNGLKISSLYLINSGTFILAWGLVIKLGLIVMAPIAETKEKSTEILRNQADSYFFDFILFTIATASILTILNVLYLKYFAKTNILKHTLTLLIVNLTILLLASYISTEWYYKGLKEEIFRHFN